MMLWWWLAMKFSKDLSTAILLYAVLTLPALFRLCIAATDGYDPHVIVGNVPSQIPLPVRTHYLRRFWQFNTTMAPIPLFALSASIWSDTEWFRNEYCSNSPYCNFLQTKMFELTNPVIDTKTAYSDGRSAAPLFGSRGLYQDPIRSGGFLSRDSDPDQPSFFSFQPPTEWCEPAPNLCDAFLVVNEHAPIEVEVSGLWLWDAQLASSATFSFYAASLTESDNITEFLHSKTSGPFFRLDSIGVGSNCALEQLDILRETKPMKYFPTNTFTNRPYTDTRYKKRGWRYMSTAANEKSAEGGTAPFLNSVDNIGYPVQCPVHSTRPAILRPPLALTAPWIVWIVPDNVIGHGTPAVYPTAHSRVEFMQKKETTEGLSEYWIPAGEGRVQQLRRRPFDLSAFFYINSGDRGTPIMDKPIEISFTDKDVALKRLYPILQSFDFMGSSAPASPPALSINPVLLWGIQRYYNNSGTLPIDSFSDDFYIDCPANTVNVMNDYWPFSKRLEQMRFSMLTGGRQCTNHYSRLPFSIGGLLNFANAPSMEVVRNTSGEMGGRLLDTYTIRLRLAKLGVPMWPSANHFATDASAVGILGINDAGDVSPTLYGNGTTPFAYTSRDPNTHTSPERGFRFDVCNGVSYLMNERGGLDLSYFLNWISIMPHSISIWNGHTLPVPTNITKFLSPYMMSDETPFNAWLQCPVRGLDNFGVPVDALDQTLFSVSPENFSAESIAFMTGVEDYK